MVDTELEKLMVEMCLKWPNKFSDADMEHWFSELKAFPLVDVLKAMSAFKAENKMRPLLPDIKTKLGKISTPSDAPPRSKFKTVIAESIAKANPSLANKPEAALILAYHRHVFFKYRKLLLWDERTESNRDASEREKAMIEKRLEIDRRLCANDLWACGYDGAAAKQLAAWLDASPPDYNGVVAQLEAQVA